MAERPIICVGDQTDHGGAVIEGSLFDTIHGRAIARVGDKVTCPKTGHGHTTVIVTGDSSCLIDGKPVARHGDKTACGAILLSSQITTTVDAGTAQAKPAHAEEAAAPPSSWLVEPPSLQALQNPEAFDHHFVVYDKATGSPASGFLYGLKSPAGELHGELLDGGATARSHAQSAYQVELSYLVQTEIGMRK